MQEQRAAAELHHKEELLMLEQDMNAALDALSAHKAHVSSVLGRVRAHVSSLAAEV